MANRYLTPSLEAELDNAGPWITPAHLDRLIDSAADIPSKAYLTGLRDMQLAMAIGGEKPENCARSISQHT